MVWLDFSHYQYLYCKLKLRLIVRYVSEKTFNEALKANFQYTSYKVKRSFVLVPGKFSKVTEVADQDKKDIKKAIKIVLGQDKKAIDKFKWKFNGQGLEIDAIQGTGRIVQGLDFANVEINDQTPSALSLVSLTGSDTEVLDTRFKLDSCCEVTGQELDVASAMRLDVVPVTNCNIPNPRFKQMYVRRRSPVQLSGCASTCTRFNWTMADLINTFAGKAEGLWDAQTKELKGTKDPKIIVDVIQGKKQGQWVNIEGAISQSKSLNANQFVLDHDEARFGPDTGDFLQSYSDKMWAKYVSYWDKGYGKQL